MRGSRKRKANELSISEQVFRKSRMKKSNPDVDLIKTTNSIKFQHFLRECEVIIDKSIVNQYLDSKHFLRNKLELNLNNTRTTCRSEKNNSNRNKLKQIHSANDVESYENGIPAEHQGFAVKMESDDDTKDILLYANDSLLVKQELLDEMGQMESSSISENNLLAIDHSISSAQEGDDFSFKDEIEIESSDALISSNNCDDSHNDDITLEEEFKSENFVLNCSMPNEDREPETYLENHENQSNSMLTCHVNTKEPVRNKINYYYCNNCDFKTISKKLLNQHIYNNYFDKDGFLPCEKCNKKFRTEKILKIHKKCCGTVFYFTCKFCPKALNTSFFIRRHIIRQHLEDFKMENLDEIMQEIIKAKVRKNKNEMAKLKNISVENKRTRSLFDLKKVIKIFCSKCNVVSERGRAVVVKNCCKCGSTLVFQCQMCRKSYSNMFSVRAHVKWSCESAEVKMIGNNTVLSKLGHERKIIIHTKSNVSPIDEKNQPDEHQLSNYECKECGIENVKDSTVCKHIEYKHIGGHYEKGLAVCLKCNHKFKRLQTFIEHKIFCGIQIYYACPFCQYTTKYNECMKKHIKNIHNGKFDVNKYEDILAQVRHERNKIKEKYIADYRSSKILHVTKSNDSFDLKTANKLFCSNCCAVHDISTNNRLLKTCPKCEHLMEYQCQRCGKLSANFRTSYNHDRYLCKSK